jgi:hypothetical protein
MSEWDEVEVTAGVYAGQIGVVFFIDPVEQVSLSIGVRLPGNRPIRIAPEQLRTTGVRRAPLGKNA